MSDEPKSNIPSNDEIVADVTKDLELHCTIDGEKATTNQTEKIPKKNEAGENLETEAKNLTGENLETEEKNFIPSNFSDSDEEEDKTVSDDNIDEEALLELDKVSTEQQKLDRKQEALDLKLIGNDEFKCEKYIEAARTYTKALRTCPLDYQSDRAILYCNRAASKIKLQDKQPAVNDCTKAIDLNPNYLKAYLRRAKLYEDLDKLEDSLLDFKKIVDLDPQHNEAKAALIRLPPIINEKNEKLKTEMLGKLKDLGNIILRPFGLSTDNFQVQQNPSTGSYSVNFQQKK